MSKLLADFKNKSTLLLCVLFFLTSIYVIKKYQPYTFGNADPGWMMLATQSLYQDRDLDLKNQLEFKESLAEDQVSLGIRGEWYPLHEWLLSLVGVPFFILFSWDGLLLCNVLLTIGIVHFTYLLLSKYFDPSLVIIVCIITYISSNLLYYSYSFSIDVLGCFIFISAFFTLTQGYYKLSGFIFSLTLIGRIFYTLAILSFILFLYFEFRSDLRKFISNSARFIFGFLPVLFLFLYLNYYMYGFPTSLSYMNWHGYDLSLLKLVPKSHNFHKSFDVAITSLFLSRSNALWVGAPFLIPGVIFGMKRAYQRSASMLSFFIITTFIFLVLDCRYENFPGEVGNRYFLILVPFSSFLMLSSIEVFYKKETCRK